MSNGNNHFTHETTSMKYALQPFETLRTNKPKILATSLSNTETTDRNISNHFKHTTHIHEVSANTETTDNKYLQPFQTHK